jgi:uncharacterized phage protein gp47/JayE
MPIPSYDDFFQAGLRAIRLRPSKFTAEVVLEEESTANTVMNIAASMMDETALMLDTSISENAFGTAMRMGGTVLDRFALDRYGDDFEPRKAAATAVVPLSFRRTGEEGCAVLRDSRVASAGGIIFRTTQDLVFAPGVKGPLTVFASCTIAGPTGNVIEGKLTQLLDKPAEDPSMAVTNLVRASGGAPGEDEGPFGGRIRGYWRAARKGTRAAVQYQCETTDGISSATVEEMLNPFNGKPEYRGLVYVADLNGSANAALAQRVQDRLPEARGLGVPVLVTGSVPVEVVVEVSGIVFAAGTQTSELLEQIRAAIVATVNALKPGESLRVAAIQAAIEQYAPQAKAPANAVVIPTGDLVPSQVHYSLKTRKELVKINGQ